MEQLKHTHYISKQMECKKMLHLLFIASSVAPPEGHICGGFGRL